MTKLMKFKLARKGLFFLCYLINLGTGTYIMVGYIWKVIRIYDRGKLV
jgi:hypothetical protein